MSAMTMWIFANHTVSPPQENKKSHTHQRHNANNQGVKDKTECDMNMTSQFLTLNRLQMENKCFTVSPHKICNVAKSYSVQVT